MSRAPLPKSLQPAEHAQLRDELLGAVQDRRAGERQPQRALGQLLRQLERRLRARGARVLHVVRLVEDQRARLELGQPLGVPVEDVVVEDDDLGRRPPPRSRPRRCGRRAPRRCGSAASAAPRAPRSSFMLAGQTTTVGNASSASMRRERLDGLAEPLLVGDERAPALERVAHARALERVQLAAELEAVQLGVLGVRERDRLGGALVLGRRAPRAARGAGSSTWTSGWPSMNSVSCGASAGVGRHGDAPGGVAQEEAARPVHRVRLGQLAEGRRRRAVPDVEDA